MRNRYVESLPSQVAGFDLPMAGWFYVLTDSDGRIDLIHTAELGGSRQRPGVVWMSYCESPTDPVWDTTTSAAPREQVRPGPDLDLDADGDLDIIACEERDNLGLYWYENPNR